MGITPAMLTGDARETAEAVARAAGIDEVRARLLPQDKLNELTRLRSTYGSVMFVGDGINDAPALSEADVGIAIKDGAEIAREIADITIGAGNLMELVNLRKLSVAMMRRIHKNYHTILGVNGTLILLGVSGILPPTASAFLHNSTTLALGMGGMRDYLPEEHRT